MPTTLEYGRADGTGALKRLLRVLMIVVASILMLVLILWFSYDWFYYRELRQIRAIFNGYPGTRVTTINGNHDLTLEDIWATVQLDRGGSVSFRSLTRAEMDGGGHVWVRSIGPYSFYPSEYGFGHAIETATGKPVKSEAYGNAIDLGASGPYASQLPVRIQSPKDVIDNYEALVAAIAVWPTRQDHTDSDGTQRRLFIVGANHLASPPHYEDMRIPDGR